MEFDYRRAVQHACTKLLEDINILDKISLPYAVPYMNYVMSWSNYLPIKTIIIGQNPYPQNIYPELGAALSYDENLCRTPPRSVRALAEDLYYYNGTEMWKTMECIHHSWHLLNNGTIMINETIFSMIYPEMKTNCGPTREMEAQCIALQSVIIASYFMEQKEFTIIGMGESAALMMDQLKKWCPSDIIKIKAIGCRNPAARERSDLPSRAFTLNHKQASKVISAQVEWYHKMPPKSSARNNRLEQSEKSLQDSLNNLVISKNSSKTEISNLDDRLKELSKDPGFIPYYEKLSEALNNEKKAVISVTNALKHNQMEFMQYVNAAKAAIESISKTSGGSNSPVVKDIEKLAKINPPRKKLAVEILPSESSPVPDIKQGLENTPAKKVKDKSVKKKLMVETSTIAPSETTAMETTLSQSQILAPATGTPSKKKKSLKNITPEETVHVITFANWFKNNVPEDEVYAGILQTIAQDKVVGDSIIGTKVVKYIRGRKKEDAAYDAHTELEDTKSPSHEWASELKNELTGNK